MTSKDIKRIINEVDDYLRRQRRRIAIDKLLNLAEQLSDGISLTELNGIDMAYKGLCHYFIQGAPDSARHAMLAEISAQLEIISDRLLRNSLLDNSGAYYSNLRMARLRNYKLPDLLNKYIAVYTQFSLAQSVEKIPDDLNRDRYELIDAIFTASLASYCNRDDMEAVKKYFNEPDADSTLLLEVISALTLSLCAWFDAAKIQMFLELASKPELSISVRAHLFIGILFAIICYPSRIAANTKLCGLLQCLADDDQNKIYLRETLKAIIGTCDTERMAAKMKEEVIPEIMKLRPEMINRMKNMQGDIDPESLENNPEWQDMLEKSGIQNKLQELAEMQNDGADLMMVTFSQLKKFSFFNKISNWFLTFDSHNPELTLSDDDRNSLSLITSLAPSICDSDKYSLVLALTHTPEQQRKLMMSQFRMQFEQVSDEIKEKLPEAGGDFKAEVIKGVRDFYRYFNLARNTEDFKKPFKIHVDFSELPVVGEVFGMPDFLEVLAEFYMKRGLYADALPLFLKLSISDSANEALWQKIGFCYQKQHDYQSALSAYMKAELLGGNSKWLTKKLAFINRKLGNYIQALDYYDKALIDDPENVKLILNAAHCAVESGNLDVAIKHYYHADYLRPNDVDIHRGMAWAEFLRGNYDKSIAIHERYIIDKSVVDYLNLGHNFLLAGDIASAYRAYQNAVASNRSEFELAFLSDQKMLINCGIDPDTLTLLLDSLL